MIRKYRKKKKKLKSIIPRAKKVNVHKRIYKEKKYTPPTVGRKDKDEQDY